MHHTIHGMFALRQGHWKLELGPGSGGWGKPCDAAKQGLPAVPLYDVSTDIAEANNAPASSKTDPEK